MYCRHRRATITLIGISIFVITTLFQYFSSNNNTSRIDVSQPDSPLCPHVSTIINNRIVFENELYYMHHYPEFICPQNFRNLADWVYGWPDKAFKEYLEFARNNSRPIVPYLSHGSIIYVKTDGLSSFFAKIYPHLLNKFVLITGQGDTIAPDPYLNYLENSDSKIIHWFAQNGVIDASRNKDFTHIPIGINCFEMAENIRGVHQQHPLHTLPSVVKKSTDEPTHYIQPFDITERILHNNTQSDKLLLLNFAANTDPTGLRQKMWKSVCENNQSFAQCYGKSDGVDISILPAIYKRNRQHPLWLSPRGNGLDCHRTWEALYLDAIPIVWHSTLDSLFTNLPIIVINDWSEINEEFLRTKLREIAAKKVQQPPVYQYEKLRNAFWRNMILSKSRHSVENTRQRKNQCWRAKTSP